MKYIFYFLAAAAITLIIIFNQQIYAFFFRKPTPPIDGTACQDASGRDGTYTNGICTAEGGPGPVLTERYAYVSSSQNTIFLPSLTYNNCHLYNAMNPYKDNGCSYIFTGYTWIRRQRFCVLQKVSCP